MLIFAVLWIGYAIAFAMVPSPISYPAQPGDDNYEFRPAWDR